MYYIYIFQALIDAHDKIGALWLQRGSGIDEKPVVKQDKDEAEAAETSPEENGDMPVETVKVVGLRKVPGQPLGLTVSWVKVVYFYSKDINDIIMLLINSKSKSKFPQALINVKNLPLVRKSLC